MSVMVMMVGCGGVDDVVDANRVSAGKCEGHVTGALDLSSDWRLNAFDNPRLNLSYNGGFITLDGVISVDTAAGMYALPIDGADGDKVIEGWSDKGFPDDTLAGALTIVRNDGVRVAGSFEYVWADDKKATCSFDLRKR